MSTLYVIPCLVCRGGSWWFQGLSSVHQNTYVLAARFPDLGLRFLRRTA